MQNERERQESESRRRNLEETERLEKEIQTLKSKVSEEAEETRRVSSRREFETRELQERIDKLNAELAMTKEHLAAATTARDQLQARVEEQGILLKSSEDKLAALSRSDSAQDVNHEQQLGIEVAELKKSLELTRTELRDAKEYAEKMKEIAATAEEALQDMNTTHDSFKEEIDKQLAEKDVFSTFYISDYRARLRGSKKGSKFSPANWRLATKSYLTFVKRRKNDVIPWNRRIRLFKLK